MKDKKIQLYQIIGIAASIIMLICNILPFANYTSNKVNYTVSGIRFLTGGVIAGGKVEFGVQGYLVASAVLTVITIILLILLPKKLEKLSGFTLLVSAANVFCNILFASGVKKTLKGAKNVSVAYGNLFVIILAVVIMAATIYIMYCHKILSALDFMIFPGLLYFFINNYIPMIGITIAFKKIDYKVGFLKSPWVGLDNFKMLFANNGNVFESDAWIITRNTLLYNIVFIALGIIFGIFVGIFLADLVNTGLKKFFQTSILLPQLLSMVIVAYIVYAFLSNETGMVNHLLGGGKEINFYQTEKYWPFILVFINLWKQIGYGAIIFLSSIVGIDKGIYEAVRVDGASKWEEIRYVTLPMLKPTIITVALMQIGRIFYSDFGLFYQVPLNSGALYNVTNTIDTYVYRLLMQSNNIAVSSAASTYQAVVGFVIVLTVNLVIRKIDKENALF